MLPIGYIKVGNKFKVKDTDVIFVIKGMINQTIAGKVDCYVTAIREDQDDITRFRFGYLMETELYIPYVEIEGLEI